MASATPRREARSSGRQSSSSMIVTPSAAFSACPDGKLKPDAAATGSSRRGRARCTSDFSTTPSSDPTAIVVAAHRAAARARRRNSTTAATITAVRKTHGCSAIEPTSAARRTAG